MTSNVASPPRLVRSARTLQLIFGALSLAILAFCTLSSVDRIGRPFPGFFVWDNAFVPAVGESYWSGVSSGLKYHSWLREADGQPIDDQAGLEAAVAGKGVGDSVEYVLDKGGRRYTIRAELMNMDVRAWVSVLGIYLVDAAALMLLGLIVLYMKPTDPAAVALFIFCLTLALYLATATDLFGPSQLRGLYFVLVNLIPVTVLNLLSRFPVGRRRRDWEDAALTGTLAVGLIMGLASNLAFHSNHALLIVLDQVTHALLAVTGLAALIFYCWHFVFATSRLARDRIKVVLLGTFGAFTLPVVMLSLVYGWGIAFPLNFLTLFFVLFPLSIGYAIAKHDLFNTDRVIKRTIVYFALTALVLGLYSLTIGAVEYLFQNLTPFASRLTDGLLILVLVLVTAPSRIRIQALVDRIYDRRRYSYRDAVGSTSRAFTTILDFERLVRKVLDLMDETLQPESACVYTVDEDGVAHPRGMLIHESGLERRLYVEPDVEVDKDPKPLLALLRDSDFALADDDLDAAGQSGSEPTRTLRDRDISLVTAMRLEGRLVGLITVGRKRAGSHLSVDDVDLLRTISDQLAVALENAQAYKRIDGLNRDLERNYTELARTNRELKHTQDQLVAKERLAAIGELAGAVAHAIRNPLAGIKAAAQLAQLEIDDEAASATVADVVSETDRLNERIGALLDFARPFEPVAVETCLNDVAGRALRDCEHKAADKGVGLVLEQGEGLPIVQADPVLLGEAASELVSNAVDITPRDGEVRVRTGVEANGGDPSIWLEVCDTGPGIRPDKRDQLFDIFFTTKPGGTGFGLATVKKIVERHGGSVSAENRSPTGARFRIELPIPEDLIGGPREP